MLAADLLHAPRALRSADGRREGAQAQGACRSGRTSCSTPSAASCARAACGSATRSRAPASSASSIAGITRRSASSPARPSRTSTASNVIDICPVGALTDRDFRFQVRVWYLDSAKSVCNGCARGCNVEVHTSRRRPHHNQGKRVARLKPRVNAEVNKWWICDEGRYGFGWIDAETRLAAPTAREAGRAVATTWDAALAALGDGAPALPARGDRRPRVAPDVERGPVRAQAPGRPAPPGERRPSRAAGGSRGPGRLPDPRRQESEHARRRAHRPRRRDAGGLDGAGMHRGGAARAGSSSCGSSTTTSSRSAWAPAEVEAALATAEMVVFQGTNANATSAAAHLVLPSAAYVEREGTFTNFEGRVQRFRTALDALGEARPDWEVVRGARGGAWPARPGAHGRARRPGVPGRWRRRCPRIAGMSYRALGDGGLPAKA